MNMAEMGLEPVTTGICNWRNRVQGSVCTAAIPSRSCPLWVKTAFRHIASSSRPMSTLGHKRTFVRCSPMSALPPIADIDQHDCDVRFVPKAEVVKPG